MHFLCGALPAVALSPYTRVPETPPKRPRAGFSFDAPLGLSPGSDGPTVFAHACKLGLEGIVSKRKDSAYRSGRSPDWLKMKNADAPAVKREAEEDWGKERWR